MEELEHYNDVQLALGKMLEETEKMFRRIRAVGHAKLRACHRRRNAKEFRTLLKDVFFGVFRDLEKWIVQIGERTERLPINEQGPMVRKIRELERDLRKMYRNTREDSFDF